MNFKQLRYFTAVVEMGSISGARPHIAHLATAAQRAAPPIGGGTWLSII